MSMGFDKSPLAVHFWRLSLDVYGVIKMNVFERLFLYGVYRVTYTIHNVNCPY